MEKDGCGVGFIVSLHNTRSYETLLQGIHALECVEHRGGVGPSFIGDGAGIMTSIPYELFQKTPETFAVAFLMVPKDDEKRRLSLKVFEETFWNFGLKVSGYRDVPLDTSVLSPHSLELMPYMVQAIIERPEPCRTLFSFEKILHLAKQRTRTKEKEHGIYKEFFFISLSPRTIVYKALCRSEDLKKLYLDLQDPNYKTNFALFHRRFSTNTISTWDKTQPFRVIAHNGEINTIEGNKAWSITREKALGLQSEELITHEGVSDSGNFNEIVEGLRFRSSIPKLAEAMAILVPPANTKSRYYKFWGRGMEPWDGPAMVAFSDGKYIGARLDRNGFRPCRWQKTSDHFYLSSEAGVFDVHQKDITQRGALSSGESITINVFSGQINFMDPEDFPENKIALFDPQTIKLEEKLPLMGDSDLFTKQLLFKFSKEEVEKLIIPMTVEGKEPIGSMGDTSRLAFLSDQPRSLFDFFYQDFAQVTNPPIDYIRERVVTDMRVYLGRKPNIFEAKEFIPMKVGLELEGPVISLGQMEYLKSLNQNDDYPDLRSFEIQLTFSRDSSPDDFLKRLEEIKEEATSALKNGYNLIILSDRKANAENLPIPSLLALTYLNNGLNESGRRLRASLILEVGDVRNAHQLACLLGHGASSVCPYLSLDTAIRSDDQRLSEFFPEEREKRLIKALTEGILRIMSKRGISVFRSYQGSKLFTPVGLGQDVLDIFFKGKKSIVGGHSLKKILELVKTSYPDGLEELPSLFLFKEHAGMKMGESHSMTSRRARALHKILATDSLEVAYPLYKEFTQEFESQAKLLRHLLVPAKEKAPPAKGNPFLFQEILSTFGSGAMSFGALSAESQRDLILAFKEIGGRSNSGEGGENPYFETEGITSTVKQIASGRFGVTAEYLVHGEEVQIKIAQGAKPGEGGQLMGIKVTAEIAKARFTSPGVDLISPAPQHDIYSIEDLKELIYEIKQLKPTLKVSVKLVSGDNIGAISVGVAKAGADIIQISGGDGGTGAASLLSMKHAGLPLEIGLLEVHRALVDNGMREKVILRADGGFTTGKDLIVAALLGAQQFDFGKLLLVAEGCIMARICEKNTCPVGIATHAPKFKAHYKGNKEKVVRLLQCLAKEVEEILTTMGHTSLNDIVGKNHWLEAHPEHVALIKDLEIDLSYFTKNYGTGSEREFFWEEGTSPLNEKILKDFQHKKVFSITNKDRAIPATLNGLYALKTLHLPDEVHLHFQGSAGQGFAVFNTKHVNILLEGEANDSVAKGMSGGKIHVIPFKERYQSYRVEENTIIGNCALYGATGGELFVHGKAGDRFAVRNSGAQAVVEGVGLHACEYMSGGLVWILREAKGNIGAGMSGGVLYLPKPSVPYLNSDYVKQVPLLQEDLVIMKDLYKQYQEDLEAANEMSESELNGKYVKVIAKRK